MQRLRGIAMLLYRKLRGLKQEDVAERISVTRKQLSSLENGDRDTEAAFIQLAQELDFDLPVSATTLDFLEHLDQPSAAIRRRSTIPSRLPRRRHSPSSPKAQQSPGRPMIGGLPSCVR